MKKLIKKVELQEKVITLLQKKLQTKNIGHKELKDLNVKFETLTKAITTRISTQYIAHVDAKEVVTGIENQTDSMVEAIVNAHKSSIKTVLDLFNGGIKVVNLPKTLDVELKTKPKWWKDAPESVKIDGPVEVKTDSTVTISVASAFLSSLVDFFTKLSNKVFNIRFADEHYVTPQTMVLFDPVTKKYVDLPTLFKNISGGNASVSISGGGSSSSSNEALGDQLDQYKISDGDETGTTKYYGFMDKYGNWYIMQNDTVANTYRYFKGTGDYATNWADRATFTYDYFNVIF